METTRHFTATVYVVHEGATLLHEHGRLDAWLPPGGHVDRDELPREAARREAREETGLDVDLLEPETTVAATTIPGSHSRELPGPEHLLLYDINVHPDGEVGHQHVDFLYFGAADHRDLSPADGEPDADRWEWFSRRDLRARDELDADVVQLGLEAIDAVETR
jgi:8-oxo-dGTP pyrophosphatase MutT (NUDIX family)